MFEKIHPSQLTIGKLAELIELYVKTAFPDSGAYVVGDPKKTDNPLPFSAGDNNLSSSNIYNHAASYIRPEPNHQGNISRVSIAIVCNDHSSVEICQVKYPGENTGESWSMAREISAIINNLYLGNQLQYGI